MKHVRTLFAAMMALLLCTVAARADACLRRLQPDPERMGDYSAIVLGEITGIHLNAYEDHVLAQQGLLSLPPLEDGGEYIFPISSTAFFQARVLVDQVAKGDATRNLRVLNMGGCMVGVPAPYDRGLFFVSADDGSFAIPVWEKDTEAFSFWMKRLGLRVKPAIGTRSDALDCVHASCASTSPTKREENVLFVGNSLTYFGNAPAVFTALSAENGREVTSHMIVRGGATLTQRVADGSVARAMEENAYSALVLQERGGDLMCSFGPESCVESRRSIQALVDLARRKKIRVVLLGTYQPDPSASRKLVESESSAAADVGIPYIEVSETLQRLRLAAPELAWFAPDGMHPGKDLTLLNALLVHKAIYGSLPKPRPLIVSAPIYGPASGLSEAVRRADAPPPLPTTPIGTRYSSEVLEKLISTLAAGVEVKP